MTESQTLSELDALRHQHQQLQAHADAMSDELNAIYRSSCESGSPIYGIQAMVINYWQFREDMGMRRIRSCPLLEVVNK